jgi:hypothetical protein
VIAWYLAEAFETRNAVILNAIQTVLRASGEGQHGLAAIACR